MVIKMKLLKTVYRYFSVFLMYFGLCAFVITSCMLLFLQHIDFDEEQIATAARYTFVNVIFLSLILTAVDTLRRRFTIERPTKQIKDALQKIKAGDFSVRLEPRGVSHYYSDIMEDINCMTRELSGVETLRTDFISNVSHEMKTQLAVMQNYGALLQEPEISDRERIEYAGAIVDGCKRLADLVTNILKLNRLENQQIYPQQNEYNLSEQLCECLLAFENIWERLGIEIETEIAEDVMIRADRELLSLVWNNLFSNAFKFTDPGGKVSVSLTGGDYYAVVRVKDNGCGMSPETGAHIFEKFYQGDTSHSTAGNGLGLALVKRIIDITDGEISVSSTLGIGSEFTVRLPLRAQSESR